MLIFKDFLFYIVKTKEIKLISFIKLSYRCFNKQKMNKYMAVRKGRMHG